MSNQKNDMRIQRYNNDMNYINLGFILVFFLIHLLSLTAPSVCLGVSGVSGGDKSVYNTDFKTKHKKKVKCDNLIYLLQLNYYARK